MHIIIALLINAILSILIIMNTLILQGMVQNVKDNIWFLKINILKVTNWEGDLCHLSVHVTVYISNI